jgi:hypothetical protein
MREVEVQTREYCLPPVVAVLRYVEYSSRNVKYTVGTESALLFGNITDPNKSKQNARVYLKKIRSNL